MGTSLNEIKTRIASTKKTSQITRAMQMVSASKLTKSEASSQRFQVYATKKGNRYAFDRYSAK